MADRPNLSEEERANLVAYLDGEMDEESARAMETRLHRDPQLRAEAESLKQAWEMLDYLPRPQPSPNFTNRTLESIAALRPSTTMVAARFRWYHWTLGMSWAAALVLAAIGGYSGIALVPEKWWPDRNQASRELEQQLVRDLSVIEHLRLYQHVDDIAFLKELDHPDLFGDDSVGF